MQTKSKPLGQRHARAQASTSFRRQKQAKVYSTGPLPVHQQNVKPFKRVIIRVRPKKGHRKSGGLQNQCNSE
jgi:hypothetical protein